jgi:hypothetical protein
MDGDEIQECEERTRHAEVPGTGTCLCGYRRQPATPSPYVDGELIEEADAAEPDASLTVTALQTGRARIHRGELMPRAVPVPSRSKLDAYMEAQGIELVWSKYAEDGRLRLFAATSLLSEETAGYSDPNVNVKILVRQRGRPPFLAVLPVTRATLDMPNSLEALAWAAVRMAVEG